MKCNLGIIWRPPTWPDHRATKRLSPTLAQAYDWPPDTSSDPVNPATLLTNANMTAKSNRELVLEEFLPYTLSILSNLVSREISAIYADRHMLSIPEWRVMAILGRFPGSSAVDIAERTLLDKVAVSRAVAKLLSSGRIQRSVATTDKRRSVLHLSPEGIAIYLEVAPLALEFEEQLLEGLNDQDLSTFRDMTQQLLDRVRNLNRDRFQGFSTSEKI